jgi:hypothetical protein
VPDGTVVAAGRAVDVAAGEPLLEETAHPHLRPGRSSHERRSISARCSVNHRIASCFRMNVLVSRWPRYLRKARQAFPFGVR